MEKFDVQIALEGVAEARAKWNAASREFRAGYDKVMALLIHEGARAFMSPREFGKAADLTASQVRNLMRKHGLEPKDGKRMLSETAAKALAENSALMGIKPHEMALTSPLAYLPMGGDLRQALQSQVISKVTEFPETEAAEERLRDAYEKGYSDRSHERDYDPGSVL